MKSTILVVSLAIAGATIGTAEEFPEFIAGMKAVGAGMDVLRKAEKKSGPQVVRAAERVAGVYEEMIPFFRQRDAKDAVKLSQEGKSAAAALASAAFAGDDAKAEAAFQALTGTCKGCHSTHRERLDNGKYKIK